MADDDIAPLPEPPVPRGNPDMPDLRNWGGVRSVKKEIRRSATIMANREAIAYELLAMGSTKITDILSWDDEGNVQVNASKDISPVHARMIKSVKATTRWEGKGENRTKVTTLEFQLFDKVSTLRLLAQAAGLLKSDEDEKRPSVVGVTVRGPKRKPVTINQKKGADDAKVD